MTLSRSSVVAMMRGVYCPLATWIATSSEPKVKTTNDSVSVMTALVSAFAPSSPSPCPAQPSRPSSASTMILNTRSARPAATGTIQSDERR